MFINHLFQSTKQRKGYKLQLRRKFSYDSMQQGRIGRRTIRLLANTIKWYKDGAKTDKRVDAYAFGPAAK